MGSLLLGIDIGTSAVKVGAFDDQGRLVKLARRSYPRYTPQPGWVEQDPEAWWAAACDAVQEVLAECGGLVPAAVGLCGQAPSQVMVAADGTPLGRAILWDDRRATAEAAWVADRISPEQALAWTGYDLIADATQPPARLRWLKNHRRAEWDRCAAVLQPKDFIAARLTGNIATDYFSSFSLFDLRAGRYHPDYLERLEVELGKMPTVLSPRDVVGAVTPQAAVATGLPAGLPVICGTIDAWCDILGCGGSEPGRAVDVVGTSEVFGLVVDRCVNGEGVYGSPLLNDLYWIGGPMQTGSAVLEWLVEAIGRFSPSAGPFDMQRLEEEAAAAPPGAGELLFLPSLRGERAPHWDAQARGAFIGLADDHCRPHLVRAVYEGMAFAVRDILERCQAAAGIRAEVLHVSGGGARSALWNQIKADVTGIPVQQMAVPDAACLGAALLGALGVGIWPSLAEAAGAMIHLETRLTPRPDLVAYYDSLFRVWRSLYGALKPVFNQLTVIKEQREL